MKWKLFLAFLLITLHVGRGQILGQDEFEGELADNDFAEFDMDEDEAAKLQSDEEEPSGNVKNVDEEDEAIVEEENEFIHFEDDEEFEGYNQDEEDDEFENQPKSSDGKKRSSSTPPPPLPKTINIAKIPAHLRNSWENYYLEVLMAMGIVVYFLNFFAGKTKNHRIASSWFSAHESLLESNFSLVGDDGAKNIPDIETPLQKESEHMFTLWCSGRTCCEGMLVELKLLKRQDLVSVIANFMKPASDQVRIRVNMNTDDMDTFVFCIANRKAAAKLVKELSDLTTFCPEKKSAPEKFGIPGHFYIMSELSEVTAAILDSKMIAMLNKYPEAIESIHFSDQYTGPKLPEDQAPAELPESKKVLIFTFNIATIKSNQSIEEITNSMKPLMLLVFYFIDKVKRLRLSKEAKAKADKNRTKVKEVFWKSIHAAKAEKAQEERERKRREVKERIREIEDPDRQRKLEERELRRERKKAQPKIKQLKVKAM